MPSIEEILNAASSIFGPALGGKKLPVPTLPETPTTSGLSIESILKGLGTALGKSLPALGPLLGPGIPTLPQLPTMPELGPILPTDPGPPIFGPPAQPTYGAGVYVEGLQPRPWAGVPVPVQVLEEAEWRGPIFHGHIGNVRITFPVHRPSGAGVKVMRQFEWISPKGKKNLTKLFPLAVILEKAGEIDRSIAGFSPVVLPPIEASPAEDAAWRDENRDEIKDLVNLTRVRDEDG